MKKIIFLLCLLFAGTATCFAQTDTIRFRTSSVIYSSDTLSIYAEPNTTIEISQGNNSIYTHTFSTSTLKIKIREILEERSSYKLYATQGKISGFSAYSEYSNGGLYSLDVSNCVNLDSLYFNPLDSLNVGGCSNLKKLVCHNLYNDNQYNRKTLDVSTCTALEELVCFSGNLDSLNVSGCTNLKKLDCSYQKLTSLDASSCSALEELICIGQAYNRYLNSLNISGCTNLKKLDCSYQKLTTLDVSSCSALEELTCSTNNLTSLNVSKNTALTSLACNSNNLTSLDVSQNTALTSLACGINNLTSLDVSQNTALTSLACGINNLTSLDVSQNTALTSLACNGVSYSKNYLVRLNVNGCTNLKKLVCSYQKLTTLDVSTCSALEELVCSGYYNSTFEDRSSNLLESLNISGCTNLKKLNCSGQKLTTLDVSTCSALEELVCSHSSLRSLNISGCTNLKKLDCSHQSLTTLNVRGCAKLWYLACGNNPLDSLDASGLTALRTLYVPNGSSTGAIKYLNVSGCTSLSSLNCSGAYTKEDNGFISSVSGKLSNLNVSGCTGLQYLDCRYNPLDSLDASGLPALKELYVPDGAGMSSSHAIKILNVKGDTSLQELNLGNGGVQHTSSDGSVSYSFYGRLKKLNVGGCINLKTLYCPFNRLEELDASGLPHLQTLELSNHFSSSTRTLKKLNVRGCTALKYLGCARQDLISLNVDSCNSLQELYCQNNRITDLTLNGCRNLTRINCADNQITSNIDLSISDSLSILYCQNNQISVLELSGCSHLKEVVCSNNRIDALEINGCHLSLDYLNCSNNRISSDFNFENYGNLRNVYCQNNQIGTLNVKGCTWLQGLNCRNNQIGSLNINGCTSLQYLDCDNNQIKQLNLLPSSNLETLSCSNNKLTTLDLSGNPDLRSVHCAYNQIKDIDISQCLDLHCFYADSNAVPLYESYSVSQFYDEYLKPKGINLWHSITEQHIQLKVKAGSLVDLHREMSFASSSTKVKVFNEADDTPLFEDVDYRITEGFLRFEQDGRYKIQLRNVNVPTNCDFENDYSPFIGTNSPVTVYYHVAYGDVAPVDTCKEPVFSHEAGEVEKGTVVEISCSTEGAQIHYTTNGNTPTEDSPLYQDGITINKTTTIKAIAMLEDWANSKVVTVTYIVPMDTCQTPVFSHEAGEVEKGTVVEISCSTEGAQIHYTTNGNTPTEDSPLYQDGITINKTTTIKAIAIKDDWENSKVAVVQYTVPGSSSGDDTLAVSPRQPQMGLRVYPNPCNGILYIETGQNNEPSGEIRAFRILDLQGREQLCAPGSVRQMDMNPIPSGIYILEAIGTKGATIRHKIVRQ